jgi:hypothetical protein
VRSGLRCPQYDFSNEASPGKDVLAEMILRVQERFFSNLSKLTYFSAEKRVPACKEAYIVV